MGSGPGSILRQPGMELALHGVQHCASFTGRITRRPQTMNPMKTIRSKSSLVRGAAISTIALLLLPAFAGAQDMPSARSLLDKHIAASGGRAALERARESVTTGTLSMPAAGLTGTMTTTAAPNRMHTRVEIPGLGEMLSGFDGTVAWNLNPIQGARILDGEEKQAIVDATREGATFRDSTVVASMKTTGKETIEGVACWQVEVVWKSGRTSRDCYAEDTGLLHASSATTESPMGSMTVTSLMLEYKEFDGVRLPTRMVQKAAGQEVTMTIEDVKIGSIPASAFEPPAEVKALIRQ